MVRREAFVNWFRRARGDILHVFWVGGLPVLPEKT